MAESPFCSENRLSIDFKVRSHICNTLISIQGDPMKDSEERIGVF